MTLLCAVLVASTISLEEPAQGVQDPGPPRGGALLMLAYEAIETQKPGPDARLVARLNAALAKNPSARATFDRLLAKWKKVPNKTRLLGAKLGTATPSTRFTEAELRNAFSADQPSALVETRSDLPDPSVFVFQSDPAKMNREQAKREASGGLLNRPTARAIAARPPIPRTLFKMEATGLYCINEGTDWGSHSEPYVLFVMYRQAPRDCWTVRTGPAAMDTGGNFISTQYLFGMVAGSQPITVCPIMLENDGWDPDELQDFVQTYMDVALPRLPSPFAARSAAANAVFQYRAISGSEDDDFLGIGQYLLTLPMCPALASTQRTFSGGQLYDFAWVFNGGSNGAYYVFFNVSRP